MTLAICWKCGAEKLGAFTVCAKCGDEPATNADKAVSLLLTDHYRSAQVLSEVSQRISRGHGPEFEPGELEAAERLIESTPEMPRGCAVALWTPIALLVVLAVVVVVLFVFGAYSD